MDLGLGTHRVKCRVNRTFRYIHMQYMRHNARRDILARQFAYQLTYSITEFQPSDAAFP